MPVERFEPLTPEEFDKRLEANNERLRLELLELEERQRKREEIIARKEAMLQRLEQTLAEIEREENEIAAMEKELPPLRRKWRYRQPVSAALQEFPACAGGRLLYEGTKAAHEVNRQ